MQLKTNKEKFQEMSGRKKIEYIKDYYTWHILGGIFGIIAIIYIIQVVNRPAPPVYSTNLLVSGMALIDYEQLDESELELQQSVDAGISTIVTDWHVMNEMTYANSQLMAIKIQAQEADVMLLSEAKFDNYMETEDLDIYYALDTLPQLQPLLEQYEQSLVIEHLPGEEEAHVYGIRVNRLTNIEGIELAEDFILSMIDEPKDLQASIDLMNYILEEE